jgi:hypothetical protein
MNTFFPPLRMFQAYATQDEDYFEDDSISPPNPESTDTVLEFSTFIQSVVNLDPLDIILSPQSSHGELTADFLNMVSASATAKKYGIDNTLPSHLIPNALRVNRDLLFPIRDQFPSVILTGWYRNIDVTKAIRKTGIPASLDSYHHDALAIDLKMPSGSDFKQQQRKLFAFIRDNVDFDKLLWEYGDSTAPDLIHVQLSKEGATNRNFVSTWPSKPSSNVYSSLNLLNV